MLMLFLSIVALLLGPALHFLSRKNATARAGLDGFVYIAIAGLVVAQILPEALALSGWWFLLPFAVGLFGPMSIEHWLVRRGPQAHAAALFIGLLGLAIHNAVDGLALVAPVGAEASSINSLGVAIALHQIPVGLMIWILIRPNYGRTIAFSVLIALCAAIGAGYFSAGYIGDQIESRWSGWLQALVGGSLLHVVTHGPARSRLSPLAVRFAGIGGLIGLGLVFVVIGTHQHDHSHLGHDHANLDGFLETLISLAMASAPSLVLGYILAGLVQTLLPKAPIGWINRGSSLSQALRGVVFGLPLPICSCGVVPLYRTLIQKGAAPAAAMAFLVATPELGIDAVMLSLPLLGPEMTIARVAAATVIALAVGWALGGFGIVKKKSLLMFQPESPAGTEGRSRAALFLERTAELFDSTSPWIILGLVVAAMLDPLIKAESLASIPRFLQLPLAALIGMPLYVCASGATPLVAILLGKGLSPGAAIVFLLTGPATNVTTFGLVAQLHGKKAAIWFASILLGTTLIVGAVVNAMIPADSLPKTTAVGTSHDHAHDDHHDHAHDHADTHDHAAEAASPVAYGSLAVLLLGVAWAMIRRGPHDYFGQIGSAHRSGAPDHAGHDHAGHDHAGHDHAGHDHDHDHDHDHHDHGSHPTKKSCCS